jgi:two-component system osmolarity sensor histidine kinase EnvZ
LRRALPRTLLARNIALLIVLVMLSQVCTLGVLLHYVQRPRVDRAAAVFAVYVTMLDNLLAATPSGARSALIARLDARAQLPPEATEMPPPSLARAYRTYQRDMFLDSLRAHLPADMPVRWQTERGQRLWIRLHAPADAPHAPYWIALPVPEDAQGNGLEAAIFLSLGLGALAALAGYAIQLHLNAPLQELTRAARRVSAGEAPAPLPTDGPSEIAAVSSAFNQMTQALQEADATRALMLAGISHDIRTPLTKLRLSMAMAMPHGSDSSFVIAAESYLDQIETILQQFMDYAGSGAAARRSECADRTARGRLRGTRARVRVVACAAAGARVSADQHDAAIDESDAERDRVRRQRSRRAHLGHRRHGNGRGRRSRQGTVGAGTGATESAVPARPQCARA